MTKRVGSYGAVLVSMTALFFEAVVTAVGYWFVSLAWEVPDRSPSGGAFLVLALPLLAGFGAVVGYLISVLLVIPTTALAGRLSRRALGRDAWWAVVVVAVVEAAGLSGGPCAVVGATLATTVRWWLYVSAVLTTTALAVRLTAHHPRKRARQFGLTAGAGAAAVVLTVAAGAVAYGTGLAHEYAPPRLTRATLAGLWSDGDGGTLRLTADGTATANRLKDYAFDQTSDDPATKCGGKATWTFDPGGGPWDQELHVPIKSCAKADWYVTGTAERPKLFFYIGDPDSWDLYVLTKRSP
jgi:hypothetical protein